MEYITSRQNPKILEAVSLRERKVRKKKGFFFFEGKKLFQEALERQVPLVALFAREDALPEEQELQKLPADCKIYSVSSSVYEKISEEKAPEGLFCVGKTIDKYHKFTTIYNKLPETSGKTTLLFAVSLRDPGNLGTVIRSAVAFGCDGLILSEDCADIYSSKTIRASMGTIFDCPLLVVKDTGSTVNALRKNGFSVYGSALDREAVTLQALPFSPHACFLLGNEGHGLPEELLAACSGKVFIPMTDRAESLNVSIAAAILLYSRFIP